MAVRLPLSALLSGPAAPRTLALTPEPGWLTVTLNRPEARNALSAAMVEELTAVLAAAASDPAVRGLSLRGAGGVFCAGGDLKDMAGGDTDPAAAAAALSRAGGALFHALDRFPRPVLALVEGPAMAGGLGLAAAADAVVATRSARLALTEVRLGLVAAQIAPMIVRRCGPAVARRLMLTAARLDGEAALACGLVDELVDDPAGLDAAEARLRSQVLAAAPGALAATKALLAGLEQADTGAIVANAADVFAAALTGPEGRAGLAAFAARRAPAWAETPPVPGSPAPCDRPDSGQKP